MAKQLHLGVFEDELEAARAYDRAALSLRLRRQGAPLPLSSVKLNFGQTSYAEEERKYLESMSPAELLMFLAGENRAARQIHRISIRHQSKDELQKSTQSCLVGGMPIGGKTSRYRGVSYHRQRKKWQANICVQGKQTFLGIFTSEERAACAYDYGAICIHMQEYQSIDVHSDEVQLRYATVLNFPLVYYKPLFPLICRGDLADLVHALRSGEISIVIPSKGRTSVPCAADAACQALREQHQASNTMNEICLPKQSVSELESISEGQPEVHAQPQEFVDSTLLQAFAGQDHFYADTHLPSIPHSLPRLLEAEVPPVDAWNKTFDDLSYEISRGVCDHILLRQTTTNMQTSSTGAACKWNPANIHRPSLNMPINEENCWLPLVPSPTLGHLWRDEGELSIADILLM
mmetsp:Transcript_6752/g.41227  ORF Transcript_6752/g.41227 Transcript_6752/m.41227 type:complete len:405 (+) Transcript_6752:431-1645(+)